MIRSTPGFTIVELLIVAVVISILATLSVVGYNGIRVAALERAAQSDLRNVGVAMQLAYQQTGTYPAELPPEFTSSSNGSGSGGSGGGSSTGGNKDVTLTVKWSGTTTTYDNLTDVQNGVLLSTVCQALIDEGVGRGVNQGGSTQNYITGCGNWNHGGMQVTGWNTRVWNTPVTSAQLLDYANAFTTNDTWNGSQVTVVKNFYAQLVNRHTKMGGTFPIKSYWDSWATPKNGGVMKQALPTTMTTRTGYCVEAIVPSSEEAMWHIDETGGLKEGPC